MAVEEPALEPTKGPEGYPVGLEGFDRVRRGFAPDQVAEYLKRVTAHVLALESRLDEMRNELFEARRERDAALSQLVSSRQDPYEHVSGRVLELVRSFDQQMGQLEREAEAEAKSVLANVRTDAERILGKAREEAERTVADAQEEAERVKAEARGEAERRRTSAESLERDARSRAEQIITQAHDEANRAESDLAALRESTLDTFRDIHSRALAALEEVQAKAAVETRAESDRLVVVDEAVEPAVPQGVPMPRPDL
jgi:cell division septum initiation protein DivIVA